MYYILNPKLRLKHWKGSRPCYCYEGEIRRHSLSDTDYALLKSCDGKTELQPGDSLFAFEAMSLIRRCGKGEFSLIDGQIREYENYYFRSIDWTITERCNYNCLHCFHAADNNRNQAEFSRDEAYTLLREAKDCGIPGIRLTGGEPTLYPHFREVLAQIKTEGLVLNTLITNGAFLNEDLLQFIKELHPCVQIMLSFDGIGTHDWMRQQVGSEQQVKQAIRLSKAAGFYVKINMNVNCRNREVMFDSVKMLIDMGADEIRIIRTTEAPRWKLNATDNSLTPEEYYDFSAEFAEQYKREGLLAPVIIWQSLALHGERKLFAVLPVKDCEEHYRDDALLCSGWINKVSVQANGEVVPCAPFAGYNTLHGISLGNMKRDGLKKVLSEGPFVDLVSQTTGMKKEQNPQCAACPYFKCCQGGCPALSILTGGSALAPDLFKCIFFQKGYYDTFRRILWDWNIKQSLLPELQKG
ncbi:MAG: radical SAM protein [Coriobacteriales bacterium]|nr:radical SAM protein [Coriobacteriales bacterium]